MEKEPEQRRSCSNTKTSKPPSIITLEHQSPNSNQTIHTTPLAHSHSSFRVPHVDLDPIATILSVSWKPPSSLCLFIAFDILDQRRRPRLSLDLYVALACFRFPFPLLCRFLFLAFFRLFSLSLFARRLSSACTHHRHLSLSL